MYTKYKPAIWLEVLQSPSSDVLARQHQSISAIINRIMWTSKNIHIGENKGSTVNKHEQWVLARNFKIDVKELLIGVGYEITTMGRTSPGPYLIHMSTVSHT